MLKGMGTVPPSSKYDIHNLVRANFHSVSACSCIYSTKCIQSIVSVSCRCHSRNDVVCHVREEKTTENGQRRWKGVIRAKEPKRECSIMTTTDRR